MANDLTYTQISTILNEIFAQATGVKQLAPVNTSQFTNVATTLIKMGYDPIMQAVSQVMGRTIFACRFGAAAQSLIMNHSGGIPLLKILHHFAEHAIGKSPIN